MIRWKQAVDRFPDYGMTFGNPDFVKYAAAYGAHGHHVGSAEALAPTLREAFGAGGMHLVAVPVDYRENFRVLVDELGRPYLPLPPPPQKNRSRRRTRAPTRPLRAASQASPNLSR
jgi:hypothetical protein